MPLQGLLEALTRRRRLLASVPLAASVVVGCGSSSAPQASTVAAVTRAGLHYSLSVTVRDGKSCSSQIYTRVGPHRNATVRTPRFCAPSSEAVPPQLVQVTSPRAVLLLDRPKAGCATVRVARPNGPLSAANTRCSTTKPTLRLTVLPPATNLRIDGVPGLKRLVFSQYPCSFICTRQLPVQR